MRSGVSPSDSVATVWCVPLDGAPTNLDFLSEDERARAARFHFPEHARRYTNARAALRAILGNIVNAPPADLVFVYGAHGKPALPGGPEFNLSHSADLALIAVASEPIGLDLEVIRENVRCLDLAERFFTAKETAALRTLTGDHQRHGFFQLWTAKEARMKATGEGLSLSPSTLEVIFQNGQPSAVSSAGGDSWKVHPLKVPPGFVAALVTKNPHPPEQRP